MTCTCPDCGTTYPGNSGGHCRDGCCQTFSNDHTAAKHRAGAFTPAWQRRCLTVEEMLQRGRRHTARGWTHRPPMPEAVMALRANPAGHSGDSSPYGTPSTPEDENASKAAAR